MPKRVNANASELEQQIVRIPAVGKRLLGSLAAAQNMKLPPYCSLVLEEHVKDAYRQKGREAVMAELLVEYEEEVALFSGLFDQIEAEDLTCAEVPEA